MVISFGGWKNIWYIEIVFYKFLWDMNRLEMVMFCYGNNMNVCLFFSFVNDFWIMDLKVDDKFIVFIRINCYCSIIVDF